MRFAEIEASQWKEVKSIYMEAFPKRERKPFFVLKHSVKRGKARVFTASDENGLLGFAVAIPYQNMVMVDYLAVSAKGPEASSCRRYASIFQIRRWSF